MNAAKDCTLQEKLLRCAMALILAAGALLASVAASPAYAAPSTVDVSIGGKIPYGGFATTWMSADGNIAYCAEPSSPTPAPGSYSTSPVPSGDVTAAIWYSFGSPGFDASMFPGSWYDGGGWDDAKYAAASHVLIAYAYSGSESAATHGTSAEFASWAKSELIGGTFEEGKVELPAELEPAKEQVEAIIIHKSQRVQIRDKAKEVSVELQKDVTLDPAFQALWDRIRQRTRFQVEVDSGKLIEHAIEAVDGMLPVRPPQVTSERASLGIDDAGVSAEGTGASVVSVSGKVKYDLPDPIAELQDAVGLTRGTIKAILEGCSRFDEFEIDPATFLAQVGDKINRVKNDLIAQGIKYVRLPEDEWYTMRDLELDDCTAYLGQNAWKPDMTSKSLYNYVVYDSAGVERSFAEALDKQEEVLVFAKLPSAFKIDTPLGSYNPDWAYVEETDGERRVYFVTETKGGKNGEPALRDAEKIKIGCAKKHFEALDLGNDFHYNVRTTYQYEAVKA